MKAGRHGVGVGRLVMAGFMLHGVVTGVPAQGHWGEGSQPEDVMNERWRMVPFLGESPARAGDVR